MHVTTIVMLHALIGHMLSETGPIFVGSEFTDMYILTFTEKNTLNIKEIKNLRMESVRLISNSREIKFQYKC